MATRRPKKIRHSLADLGDMVKHANERDPEAPPFNAQNSIAPDSKPTPPANEDSDLFEQAMADVTPLHSKIHWQMPKRRRTKKSTSSEDETTLDALQRLVDEGEGFRVADTPEYMEAAGPGADRSLIRRLHQGRYAVQGHVDLHGLSSAEAQQELVRFIGEALVSGKRMVLVIHGRGLTSPGPPVLKQMVYTWLTRGPFRRHVLAFTSARPCDGGAGATYVLLRKRPWKKPKRKRR